MAGAVSTEHSRGLIIGCMMCTTETSSEHHFSRKVPAGFLNENWWGNNQVNIRLGGCYLLLIF